MSDFLVNEGPVLTEHLKVIRKLAWHLSDVTGYDPDDLFGEGCLKYLLTRENYNPKNSVKFTTFLWKAVSNHLFNYIRDRSKTVLFIDDDSWEPLHKKNRINDAFQHKAF